VREREGELARGDLQKKMSVKVCFVEGRHFLYFLMPTTHFHFNTIQFKAFQYPFSLSIWPPLEITAMFLALVSIQPIWWHREKVQTHNPYRPHEHTTSSY
jgi:hypothetical protein